MTKSSNPALTVVKRTVGGEITVVGVGRMDFGGRLERMSIQVDADGIPPVINRDAYDGTHKRADGLTVNLGGIAGAQLLSH